MFAYNKTALPADFLRIKRFVGAGIMQYAMGMDTRLMGKGVGADNGLPRRHRAVNGFGN